MDLQDLQIIFGFSLSVFVATTIVLIIDARYDIGLAKMVAGYVRDNIELFRFKREAMGRDFCRIGYLEKQIDGKMQVSFNGGKTWFWDERVMARKAEFEKIISDRFDRGSSDWWATVMQERYGNTASFFDDKFYPIEKFGCVTYDLVSVDGGNTYLALDRDYSVEGLEEELYPGLVRYIEEKETRIIKGLIARHSLAVIDGGCERRARGEWQWRFCPKNTKI